MREVYCKNCKHLYHLHRRGESWWDFCTKLLHAMDGHIYLKSTEILNLDGDCNYYERKWYKFWIINDRI